MILLNRKIEKNRKTLLTGAAHFFAGLLVVYNNSDLTLIAWYFSLFIFIGFAYIPSLRSVFFSITGAIIQGMAMPVTLTKHLSAIKIGGVSLQPIFKNIKYVAIPILLLLIFGSIYSAANESFGNYMELILTNIGNFIELVFNFFFSDVTFMRLLFFLFGLTVSGALLLYYKNDSLKDFEGSLVEKLFRIRKARKNGFFDLSTSHNQTPFIKRKMLGLKVESVIGILSFSALNILIFSLNLLDFSTLWLGKTGENINYSAELHDGTNALIFSIVMAMMVILYFFRGNLNFYKKNKIIQLLAYLWIVQNAFLVASVFLRDYHYMDMHGLTYKRIGVLVFLLLCIIGLITVYIKVKQQKTLFYLLKANGLMWYVLLLFFSCFNWDVIILSFNIAHQFKVAADVPHVQKMSDKIIPVLHRNRAQLKAQISKEGQYNSSRQAIITKADAETELDRMLDWKISSFTERWEKTSWLSWNYRDWQTYQYLKQNHNYE
jgi:hypothetical protein